MVPEPRTEQRAEGDGQTRRHEVGFAAVSEEPLVEERRLGHPRATAPARRAARPRSSA